MVSSASLPCFGLLYFISTELLCKLDLLDWNFLGREDPHASNHLTSFSFSDQDNISHPTRITPCAEEMSIGNPSSTREYQNTASSTLPRGKTVWGFRSRLWLPQPILYDIDTKTRSTRCDNREIYGQYQIRYDKTIEVHDNITARYPTLPDAPERKAFSSHLRVRHAIT